MMKTSPYFMAFFYGGMGALFTYLAILTVEDTIWNITTVLLMLLATFDFVTAIRFIVYRKYLQNRKPS